MYNGALGSQPPSSSSSGSSGSHLFLLSAHHTGLLLPRLVFWRLREGFFHDLYKSWHGQRIAHITIYCSLTHKNTPPKQGKYCAETRTPYSNIYSFLDMLAHHRRGKPSNPVSLQVWIPPALFPRPRQRWLEWVPRQHCQVQLAALKPREAAQVVRHWLPQEAIGSLIVSKAAPQTPQLVQVG